MRPCIQQLQHKVQFFLRTHLTKSIHSKICKNCSSVKLGTDGAVFGVEIFMKSVKNFWQREVIPNFAKSYHIKGLVIFLIVKSATISSHFRFLRTVYGSSGLLTAIHSVLWWQFQIWLKFCIM